MAGVPTDPRGNRITSPTSDSIVTPGTEFLITWEDLRGDTVRLVLDRIAITGDTSRVGEISSSAPNTGSYAWAVPDTLDSAGGLSYQILLFYTEGIEWSSISLNFQVQTPLIEPPPPPPDETSVEPSPEPSPSPEPETLTPTSSSSNIEVETTSSSTPPPTSESRPESTSLPRSITSTSLRTTTSRTSPIPSTSSISPNTISSSSTTTSSSATDSNTAPPSSNGPPVGIIVGSVIGGVALLIFGVLVGLWIIVRERRKRAQTADIPATSESNLQSPLPIADAARPSDPNNQSVWEGDRVYSWNPTTQTPDIYPGYR